MNAYIEINAGSGGEESQDWASMLARMYRKYACRVGFSVEDKNGCLFIKGQDPYRVLMNETGVHRLVRISPFDRKKRRHTSFASVSVRPETKLKHNVDIADSDLRIDTFRSTGPGGQHRNKTDSAVRITHKPTGIVVVSAEKSQHQNRALAMDELQRRLNDRERDRVAGAKKDERDSKGAASFGKQVRSYVLNPKQFVKDERTGKKVSNAEAVLNGKLDCFLN